MRNIWSIRSLMFSTWPCRRLSINPTCRVDLNGNIQYMFSLYNVMSFSKTTFIPCCINESFIVPNPCGTVKSWTNCPSNCSTKIHPENKLIKITKYLCAQAHLPCVRRFCLYFPNAMNIITHIFQQEACSQIKVHCLTSYRVILETHSRHWTKNSCFFHWSVLFVSYFKFDISLSVIPVETFMSDR